MNLVNKIVPCKYNYHLSDTVRIIIVSPTKNEQSIEKQFNVYLSG